MSLYSIQVEAEDKITAQIESLRDSVTLAIANVRDLTGYGGSALRQSLKAKIELAFGGYTRLLSPYVRQAITEGAQRASFEGQATGSIPMTQPSVAPFEQAISAGFYSLQSDVLKKITIPLSRAALKMASYQDAIDVRPIFDDAEARARGIITNELSIAEAFGHNVRAKEIEKAAGLKKKSSPTKVHEYRLAVSVWIHRESGDPRLNHEALDGLGIVAAVDGEDTGATFTLEGRDGQTYRTLGPHLPPLPIGEQINCHCIANTEVVFVDEKTKDALVEKSLATGGFLNSLWK